MILQIPQIYFTGSALQNMLLTAQKCKRTETGGLLLGKILSLRTGRTWIVSEATGPGPSAILDQDGFRPDMDYYRKVRSENPDLLYLGEWHKHPGGYSRSSLRDLDQAKEILLREGRQELLCPICHISDVQQGVTGMELECFYINSDLKDFIRLSYSTIAEPEREHGPLRYLAVEDLIIRKFLCSRRPYQIAAADWYPDNGTAHIFSSPLEGRHGALLIHSNLCSEVNLPPGIHIAVSVSKVKGKAPQARGYFLTDSSSQEIHTEIVSLQKDIFRRNQTLLETTALRGKHVAIFGLGSIGADAALELARAGVDRFTLIDPDTVALENLCRHVCDLSDLGTKKVHAVARRIRRILPYADVRCYPINANKNPDNTLHICENADIVLISTDTENSRKLANWIAHYHHIPAIFAGLLERASGGRVWRIIPGETACYQCYPSHQSVELKGPVAYSEIQSLEDLDIQPGLGNDIAFITHLSVRYVMDTLIKQEGKDGFEIPYHLVFWFNHSYPKLETRPLTLYRVEKLPRREDCSFCSLQGKKSRKEDRLRLPSPDMKKKG